jgi:hypothetical protein
MQDVKQHPDAGEIQLRDGPGVQLGGKPKDTIFRFTSTLTSPLPSKRCIRLLDTDIINLSLLTTPSPR